MLTSSLLDLNISDMPRSFSDTKRAFPKRQRKEAPHAQGPFRAELSASKEHWLILDAEGKKVANCGKDAQAAVNAEWMAGLMSKACQVEAHAKRVAKAFAAPEKP